MMWEEQIDKLKKEFSSSDFYVHFTDGSTILKKIENEFVRKQDDTYYLLNWTDRIKNKYLIKSIYSGSLMNLLKGLNEYQSYWIVIVMGDALTSKQYVYSCSLKPLLSLTSMAANDFFIVDKKLAWLMYFHRNGETIDVYKSGEVKTPIDNATLN